MAERVLLYVEDDDAAFFILELALREAKAGIDLYRAVDGEEALAFLRKSGRYGDAPRPDLILLDINLPKRSGMEVLTEMKADRSLGSIPVVMLSSSSQAADKSTSLKLGARDYVVKPSSFECFIETVRNACSVGDDT